mmetsp:Transcript_29332/g.75617  ORF Transcript_29332/g.75617 Transcript_29332/m.75617 type:complete len:205 (-) Transcript_29332:793-1407(-)
MVHLARGGAERAQSTGSWIKSLASKQSMNSEYSESFRSSRPSMEPLGSRGGIAAADGFSSPLAIVVCGELLRSLTPLLAPAMLVLGPAPAPAPLLLLGATGTGRATPSFAPRSKGEGAIRAAAIAFSMGGDRHRGSPGLSRSSPSSSSVRESWVARAKRSSRSSHAPCAGSGASGDTGGGGAFPMGTPSAPPNVPPSGAPPNAP